MVARSRSEGSLCCELGASPEQMRRALRQSQVSLLTTFGPSRGFSLWLASQARPPAGHPPPRPPPERGAPAGRTNGRRWRVRDDGPTHGLGWSTPASDRCKGDDAALAPPPRRPAAPPPRHTVVPSARPPVRLSARPPVRLSACEGLAAAGVGLSIRTWMRLAGSTPRASEAWARAGGVQPNAG